MSTLFRNFLKLEASRLKHDTRWRVSFITKLDVRVRPSLGVVKGKPKVWMNPMDLKLMEDQQETIKSKLEVLLRSDISTDELLKVASEMNVMLNALEVNSKLFGLATVLCKEGALGTSAYIWDKYLFKKLDDAGENVEMTLRLRAVSTQLKEVENNLLSEAAPKNGKRADKDEKDGGEKNEKEKENENGDGDSGDDDSGDGNSGGGGDGWWQWLLQWWG